MIISLEKQNAPFEILFRDRIEVKNIKLQPVPPPMPSESLSVRLSGINSASNGIGGGTDCNFIYLFDLIQLYRPIHSLCCRL